MNNSSVLLSVEMNENDWLDAILKQQSTKLK